MQHVDSLILGGTIITMDAQRRIVRDGALATRQDKIVFVGKRQEAVNTLESTDIIHADQFIITPGLIDGHVHITGDPLTRGYVPDEIDAGFTEKLTRWVIPRFQAHTAEDERLSAQLQALAMLRCGTTCFLEAGTIRHLDAVVEGLNTTGIRGRVGGWVEGRVFDGQDEQRQSPAEAIQRLTDEITRYPASDDARIAAWPVLIGHHTNSDAVWQAAKSLADANGVGVSAHMSPYASDPVWYLQHTGRRPVEHLHAIGVLGGNVCLTHAVHIDEHEQALLAETHTHVIHCPIAAMRDACGLGTAGRFPEMAAAGINLLLGSDGYSPDLMLAMKATGAIFKDAREDSRLFPAASMLEMATVNAAKALQLEQETGALAVGKKADFVLHDTDRPEWQPRTHVLNQLVCSADGRGVHSVWVDGVRVINNYRSTLIDEAALYRRVQSASEAILVRSGVPFICPWPIE